MKIAIIFTCFNRKDKTFKCISNLISDNREHDISFVVVDDGSTDGTKEMLSELGKEYKISVINTENKFYSAGMRMGMEYILNQTTQYDYLLMINDDVDFKNGCISMLIEQSVLQNTAVIVGTIVNSKGEWVNSDGLKNYGAVKYTRGVKYKTLGSDDWEIEADCFNANCVLIPYEAFKKTGSIDRVYKHSLGDFDYGFMLKRNGYRIFSSRDIIGSCDRNSRKGTWIDSNNSIRKRIQLKESVKGQPFKPWFHYLKKNFGLRYALYYSVTPYIRILLKK